MMTKLFLQSLLALGCVLLIVGTAGSVVASPNWPIAPEGWWRGAMACWMLVVAVRMVYPDRSK